MSVIVFVVCIRRGGGMTTAVEAHAHIQETLYVVIVVVAMAERWAKKNSYENVNLGYHLLCVPKMNLDHLVAKLTINTSYTLLLWYGLPLLLLLLPPLLPLLLFRSLGCNYDDEQMDDLMVIYQHFYWEF